MREYGREREQNISGRGRENYGEREWGMGRERGATIIIGRGEIWVGKQMKGRMENVKEVEV